MIDFDNDVPKYKKKAKKNTPKKSDHKHVYEDCVFHFPAESWHPESFTIGSYCPVCGKIGTTINEKWVNRTDRTWPHYDNPRFWNEEGRKQLCEETRTLPLFEVSEWFAKYIQPKE